MSKRTKNTGWLQFLPASIKPSPSRRPPLRVRTAFIEQLECRRVLSSAPVANNDGTPTAPFAGVAVNSLPISLNVTFNDTDDATPYPSLIPIIATSPAHGTVSPDINNPNRLSYQPAAGYSGPDSFSYRVNDGEQDSANTATVYLIVGLVANAGGNGYTIGEGDSLQLDSTGTVGSDLTYSWFIDPNPTHANPLSLPSSVFDGSNVLTTTNPFLTWDDLDAFGVDDGNIIDGIVALRIEDGNGNQVTGYSLLRVGTFPPTVTSFDITPAGSCGGNDVLITATFTEVNPNDVLSVYLTEDLIAPSDEVFLGNAIPTGPGTFSISVPYTYSSGGPKFPQLHVTADGGNGYVAIDGAFVNDEAPGFAGDPEDPNFPFVTIGEGGTPDDPVAEIGAPTASTVPQRAIAFANSVLDACGVAYTWSINGNVVPDATDPTFVFTPTAVGSFDVTLTATDGVTSQSDTTTVTVTSVISDGAGNLLVGSAAASNDAITFTPAGPGLIAVSGVTQPGTFAVSGAVDIYGDANDSIVVNGDADLNSFDISASDLSLSDYGTFIHHGINNSARTINARGAGDSITVSGGYATVNGGSGSDTLQGPDAANTWAISAQNQGTLTYSGGQIIFTSVENLTGGSQADVFQLGSGVGVSGNIGGGGGNDSLDYSAFSTAVSVNLNNGNATKTGGISGIESIIGGGASDTITGQNTGNTWNVTGSNSGNVAGVSYSSFENLKGGTSADTFQIGIGGGVSGTLNGGGGADVVSYSAFSTAVAVNLATSSSSGVAAFSSIASFVGGSGSDTLTGKDANSVWIVSGAGSGTVGATSFSAFESLAGGSANDTFRVSQSLSSGIAISGGNAPGIDKLDYAAHTSQVIVDLGNNSATGFAGVSGIENIAGGDANDILRGDGGNNVIAGNAGNDIVLGGGGNDTINGNAGRDILIGGAGADSIVGNADEDILIAGTTGFDGIQSALDLLLLEWTSTAQGSSYANRTGHIMGTIGGGQNGGIFLIGDAGAGQTVFDDSAVDQLTGSGGVDWFFANLDGTAGVDLDVTDKTAAELWNDTDL